MADATGYTSQFSWQLYDTSGTTEDWNYAAQGAYGYTIEIGPQGGQFHMPYETGVVNEWTGGGKRPGLREALLIAAESAANPSDHSTITGHAPAGRVLRLHKAFRTSTSPICAFSDPSITSKMCKNQGDAQTIPDMLDYTMSVPASGSYSWSVGPSTRPFVAEKWELGEMKQVGTTWKKDGTMPADRKQDEIIPFSWTAADLASVFQAEIKLEWDPANAADLDLYVDWKDPVSGEWRQVASSGNPAGSPEKAMLIQPRPGDYRLRINSFLAPPANPYHASMSLFSGSIKVTKSGVTEAYTMTCETPDGKVLESKDVTVGRGQTAAADFACGTGPQGNNQSGAVLGLQRRGVAKTKTRSARAVCLQKASRVKGKARRRAAVRRCNKRFPVKAKPKHHSVKKHAVKKKRR
jgi:hypothetical protein